MPEIIVRTGPREGWGNGVDLQILTAHRSGDEGGDAAEDSEEDTPVASHIPRLTPENVHGIPPLGTCLKSKQYSYLLIKFV
jgi:hypothetical protein